MRRFDKKKNIEKANLLAESRYLESKGLINEITQPQEAPQELINLLMKDWAMSYENGLPGIGDVNDNDYYIEGECMGDYEISLSYYLDDAGAYTFSYTGMFSLSQTGSPRRATHSQPEEFLEYEIADINAKNMLFKDNIKNITYTTNNKVLHTLLRQHMVFITKQLEETQEIGDCSEKY